ncbi:hypothetical protein [Afipia sp. P52-10]|uniref:hypothetical protein n=1 Tax=Afipia sp. P52-10 TaxID=1429916 RepID=UPI0012693C55|nr:hypothetical protein [Afipia sp. P52-10]
MSGGVETGASVPASRRVRTALQIAGIAVASLASIALHLAILNTLLMHAFKPSGSFGRWDPRYFLHVQNTSVGRVGIHAALPDTLFYAVLYDDDDVRSKFVYAEYASSATADDLRVQYAARCLASRLDPFQDEEVKPSGETSFFCVRTVSEADNPDPYPLLVTINPGIPTKISLLTAVQLDD